MTEYLWVREDVARAVHLRQIAEHGGSAGIRDEGLLQSALARPQNLIAYSEAAPDLASLAASYAYGIARNHPFVDGNKRTALVVCRLFLLLNGANLNVSQEEKYLTFMSLAEGTLMEEELADWIRGNMEQA